MTNLGQRGKRQPTTNVLEPGGQRPLSAPPDACLVVAEVAACGAHEALEAGKGQGVVLKQLHKDGGQVGPAGGRGGLSRAGQSVHACMLLHHYRPTAALAGCAGPPTERLHNHLCSHPAIAPPHMPWQ